METTTDTGALLRSSDGQAGPGALSEAGGDAHDPLEPGEVALDQSPSGEGPTGALDLTTQCSATLPSGAASMLLSPTWITDA
jgi:hypothetical protein